MSRAGGDVVMFILGMVAGALMGVILLGFLSTTPRDVYGEVCADIFDAEYVPDLRVCLDGDAIVHRFGEDK